MDMHQLKYFLASAEKGSLTKAAEALYTTQPHVSQVISSLEKDLGVKLFERTARGIALTAEGERIRVYAQNIAKNSALIREVCDDRPSGRIRIAVNPSSSLAFLIESFFLEKGADLSLQYTECGIEQMLSLLEERQYDLGLLFVAENKKAALSRLAARHHLEYTELRTSDLVLHSGRRSPFYGRPLLRPEELDGCGCIQLDDDFFSVEEMLMDDPAFRSGRCSLRKVIRTNSDHLMIHMLQGTELSNLGTYWQTRDFASHGFSMSVIDGFQKQISFGYLHAEGRPLRAEIQPFLEMVREAISEEDGNP